MPKVRPYMKYRADISTAIGYVIELIETSALAPLRSVVDHFVVNGGALPAVRA
jgi:hypothetical protein